jgi:hypothetical protein
MRGEKLTSPLSGHVPSETSHAACSSSATTNMARVASPTGQVAAPSGMCLISKTATWVWYVLTLLMRTLLRPGPDGSSVVV